LSSVLSAPIEFHRGDPGALEEMLAIPGALMAGHFELLSGAHTDRFLAFSRIVADPTALSLLAGYLLPSVAAQSPTVIVAPSTAGVGLGWALAQRLGVALQLAAVNASGRAESLIGDADVKEQRALLVNDVVTTGDGFKALADVVRAAGASVVGACWFMTRSRDADVQTLIDGPIFPVLTMPLESWPAKDCELCGAAVALQPALDLN
jgi:orotate phosphoribosyltransferase